MDSPLAPLLRPEAERLAREAYNLEDRLFHDLRVKAGRTRDLRIGWDRLPEIECESRVLAHLALLTDLTRPEARSFLREWVAKAAGADPSNGAIWERQQTEEGQWEWVLSTMTYGGREVAFADHYGLVRGVCYPVDIGGILDPAEALTLAALALATPETIR